MTPDQIRERIASVELQVSALDFLCAHEPDLVAAAESLGIEPAAFSAARERLGR